jgi:hypothetical protein
MQAMLFFDVMIMPMPPETSHVSVPTLVRLGACAIAGAGSPTAAATARAAKALKVLRMGKLQFNMIAK